MAEEKVYSRVKEAEEIIKKLCEKQPEVLWCVKPETVAVLGIENKERGKKNKTLAKIGPVKGSMRTILADNNIPIRYVCELYWSDYNNWREKQKQWVLFHELLHIHHEVGKTIKHDLQDFKIIIQKTNDIDWFNNSEKLPDLINDKVDFNLELRPSMQDVEVDEEDKEEKE